MVAETEFPSPSRGSTPEEGLALLAERLGVPASEVQRWDADWPTAMRQGVVVDLHIGRKRLWKTLSRDDLGLTDLDDQDYMQFEKDYLELGRKALFPKSMLREADNAEKRARTSLEKYSTKTFWGRFVSAKAFAKWRESNEEIKAEYFAARDNLVGLYDELVGAARRQYTLAAYKAYDRVRRLSPETAAKVTEDQFVRNFVQQILVALPSKDGLYDSFTYQENIFFIPIPSQVAEELRQ